MSIRQRLCDCGVDIPFIVALVHHHLALNDAIGFRDQGRRILRRSIIERVGDSAESIEPVSQRDVIVAERPARGGRYYVATATFNRTQGAQGVENDGDVDANRSA
jgi:hypothetical protein